MSIIFRFIAIVGLLSSAILSISDGRPAGTAWGAGSLDQDRPPVRAFIVKARRYAYSPSRIEVDRGDLVKITLIAEDIPHSFTIDEYRISKRASPDRSVTFGFFADKPGAFVFYCDLTIDERCREMRGQLVVR